MVSCCGSAALIFRKWVELFTSVHIDVHAKIGPGFVIHSVYAINLGKTTIGENFTIATGCLISHACRGIGDNVYFGPGAKLVGDAKIGSNVVIAANSLVLTDVRVQHDGDGSSGAHQVAGWASAEVCEEDGDGSGSGDRRRRQRTAQVPRRRRRNRQPSTSPASVSA